MAMVRVLERVERHGDVRYQPDAEEQDDAGKQADQEADQNLRLAGKQQQGSKPFEHRSRQSAIRDFTINMSSFGRWTMRPAASLHAQHMDVADRLFCSSARQWRRAPRAVPLRQPRSGRGVGTWQRLERLLDRASRAMSAIARPAASASGMPISSISGSATSIALVGKRQRHRDDAGEAQPPARGDSAAPRRRSEAHRPCRCVRTATSSMISAGPGASRTRSPLRQTSTCGTPASRASSACSARCSASPCAGIRIFGRTQLIMSSNSARRGWPDT